MTTGDARRAEQIMVLANMAVSAMQDARERPAEDHCAAHLGRKAIVHLRQSSMAQVRDNTESTTRQYALADLAADLGWPRPDVTAIDADLGTSGRSVEHRQGLRDLVTRMIGFCRSSVEYLP